MFSKNDYGLVFTGGGAKGAYQIGAWKALDEMKITPRIKAVSGSSVGALNALLFSQVNYQSARETWLSVKQEDMLFKKDTTQKQIVQQELSSYFEQKRLPDESSMIAPLVFLSMILPKYKPLYYLLSPLLKIICNNCCFGYETVISIAELIRYSIINGGAFLQDRLAKIIDDILFISDNRLRIKAFATICKEGDLDDLILKNNAEYIELNSKTPSQVREIVLASSALPLIYPKRKIGEYKYYDGGWADNTPIKPIYDLGIRKIIIVYLENNRHNKLKRNFIKEDKKFPDADFIRLIPGNDFKDDFLQTISISEEQTNQRISQGYEDAVKQSNFLKM